MTKQAKPLRKRVPLLAKLVRPKCWPLWVRRIGILLFPVALMLWTVLIVGAFIGRAVSAAGRGIASLWNDKSMGIYRSTGYGDYSYGRSRRR